MSNLNLTNCGTTGNLGVAQCGLDPQLFQRAILIPKGFVIPSASLTTADTVMTYIQNKLEADSRSSRFFLTTLLTNMNNKTDAPKEEERDGFKKTVFEGAWNLEFYLNGSICDYTNMLNFNRQQSYYDVLMVDSRNVVYGRKDALGLGGWSLYEIYTYVWKPATVSTAAQYVLSLKFGNNADYTTNIGWFDASSSSTQVANMDGLVEVTLSAGTTSNTSSAIYVYAKLGCDAANMGDYYATVLNTASAWTVTSSVGVARSLTGVTYNSTTKQWAIASSAAFSNGDLVSLKAPSVLLGIDPSANLITETTLAIAI